MLGPVKAAARARISKLDHEHIARRASRSERDVVKGGRGTVVRAGYVQACAVYDRGLDSVINGPAGLLYPGKLAGVTRAGELSNK